MKEVHSTYATTQRWVTITNLAGKNHDKSRTIYGCAKRGCDKTHFNFDVFAVGFPVKNTYCLDHIPLLVRIKMYFKERNTA